MNVENYSELAGSVGNRANKLSKSPKTASGKFDAPGADLVEDPKQMIDEESGHYNEKYLRSTNMKKAKRTNSNATKSSSIAVNDNNKQPIHLKKNIENKKSYKKEQKEVNNNVKKGAKNQYSKKSQVQPKQKKNRLKSAAPKVTALDLNQPGMQTHNMESNKDIQLGNFFNNQTRVHEPPQLALMTEHGQGFFDPTDF